MPVKEIHHHDYAKGSARYTIHVEEGENGGMWGTWNCQECNVGGSTSRMVRTIDEAIDAAKSDLERHHVANHEI